MARKFKRSGPKTLEEKLYEIDKRFIDELRCSTVDQVKEKMISLDRNETELIDAKKDDSDLASKREALKVANQTYSEPLKAIKLKRAFALKVLSEKK